jgi:hypothetical protein
VHLTRESFVPYAGRVLPLCRRMGQLLPLAELPAQPWIDWFCRRTTGTRHDWLLQRTSPFHAFAIFTPVGELVGFLFADVTFREFVVTYGPPDLSDLTGSMSRRHQQAIQSAHASARRAHHELRTLRELEE